MNPPLKKVKVEELDEEFVPESSEEEEEGFTLGMIQSTTERQGHGKAFETWFIDTFVKSSIRSGHTDKWDVRGVTYKNKYATHTAAFNGLPISVKTCKYGGSVNFGDAIRQLENTEDFLLVVAFYQGKSPKQVVHVVAKKVGKGDWQDLFIDMTSQTGSKLECAVKTRESILNLNILTKSSKAVGERRTEAKKTAKGIKCLMTLNPKIHSDGKARLQCSLSKKNFCRFAGLGTNIPKSGKCTLWGETVPSIK